MPGGDDVVRNLKDWSMRMLAATIALARGWAGKLESSAKENASWIDRTGNAREGLFGSTAVVGDEVMIRLGHSMDYGVFLELANDGKYAILKPTIDAAAAEIFASYRKLWEG